MESFYTSSETIITSSSSQLIFKNYVLRVFLLSWQDDVGLTVHGELQYTLPGIYEVVSDVQNKIVVIEVVVKKDRKQRAGERRLNTYFTFHLPLWNMAVRGFHCQKVGRLVLDRIMSRS